MLLRMQAYVPKIKSSLSQVIASSQVSLRFDFQLTIMK